MGLKKKKKNLFFRPLQRIYLSRSESNTAMWEQG